MDWSSFGKLWSRLSRLVLPRPGKERKRPSQARRYRPGLEVLEDRVTPSTYFVNQADLNATDQGGGTSGQPFITIGAAATRAIAGDFVVVSSGTYQEQVTVKAAGTAAAPVVFMAAEGATVTVTGGTYGFSISAKSWVTLRGFRVTGTSAEGINVSTSSNITLQGNDVSFAGQPVSGLTATGIRLSGTTSSLVSQNVVHHNSDAGIFLTGGSSGVVVSGNEVFQNARGYIKAAPGIDVRSGNNTIIANHLHHNEDSGIQIRSNTGTTDAVNNFVISNISHDNGDHGIDILRAPGHVIVGNSLYNNFTAGINIDSGSSNATLANNISVGHGVGNIRVHATSITGTTLDYDLLWLPTPTPTQYVITWGTAKYTTLAAFVAATGMESHGLQANPLWVAPSSGDFHLQAGSPAIDSANSGAPQQRSSDAEGKPRVDIPATTNTGAGPRDFDDRGALEFQLPPGPATLQGVVFEDRDGNSLQDGPDQGLEGRTVFIDANGTGALEVGEAYTSSLADGSYKFTGLTPGTYRLRQVVPVGWTQTTAVPADVNAGPGSTTDVSFGNFRNVSISGTVFGDQDADGAIDQGETGLSGWVLFLDANNNGNLDNGEPSTVSGSGGTFQFTNLGPGTYRVRQVSQPGWPLTTAVPAVISASSGVDVSGVLFGNVQGGSISGQVFYDEDRNGLKDSLEPGLSGWTVFLDANANSVLDTGEAVTATDTNGNFSFGNLLPGTYPVRLVDQPGWLQTTANAQATVNSGTVTPVFLGVVQIYSLLGNVFEDHAGDSVKDGIDQGLAGWTVFLDANANGAPDVGEATRTTDGGGNYSFVDVAPGTYRPRLVPMLGWVSTTADVDVTLGSVSMATADFGVFEKVAQVGQVFEDHDADSFRDANDQGLAGWTVFLDDDANGTLDSGESSVVTGSSGTFAFNDLGPGISRLRLVPQSGWTATLTPAAAQRLSGVDRLTDDFGLFRNPIGSMYYVNQADPNATDQESGTLAQPFLTIGAAATRALAGDTVVVASGSYQEQVTVKNSGNAAAPVVFMAAEGATVTVTGGKYGFLISAMNWITIRGFHVTGTTNTGIYALNSSNLTLEGNEVSFAGQPVNGLTAEGIKVTGTTNSLITKNTIHHNTDAGIYLKAGSTGNTISGNESFLNAQVYQRAAPGIDIRSSGNTIIGNHTHHNEDSGIQVRSNTGNTEAANNFILSNITHDNGDHGIDVLRAVGQVIVGNSVYNNQTAGINVEGNSSGATLANNISVDNAIDSTRTQGNIRVDAGSIPGTTLDYNLLWLRSTPNTQYQIIWGSTRYTTLAAFVAATGMESHGLQADPLWVAPNAGNFHLQAGSPAIDSANSGAPQQPITDAEGNARVDDPSKANTGIGPRTFDDRGAFEFQPPPS